jgi:hypothetical protein
LHPLADDAWPDVSLAADDWADWLDACDQTILLRRWVPGPNGPSFLTEYTPADDYVTEGHNGRHDTFNGLYRDEDRRFYIPQPQDLEILERAYLGEDYQSPDWHRIRAALCAAGHADDELATMKAPVLISLLGQLPAPDVSDTQDQVPQATQKESVDVEQFGKPQVDPYDNRVVNWFGKRIYLGHDTQISRLFWLLAESPGVPQHLSQVQRAVDGMETDRDAQGEDAFGKAMNRVRKAISKLRDRLREHELDDHVMIVKDGPADWPSYTMLARFGKN